MSAIRLRCGIQQDHSLREEVLPEPSVAGAVAPVMPAAWEDSKKSMLCVGCILDNTFTFLVNVLNGGQLGAGDLLGSPG